MHFFNHAFFTKPFEVIRLPCLTNRPNAIFNVNNICKHHANYIIEVKPDPIFHFMQNAKICSEYKLLKFSLFTKLLENE